MLLHIMSGYFSDNVRCKGKIKLADDNTLKFNTSFIKNFKQNKQTIQILILKSFKLNIENILVKKKNSISLRDRRYPTKKHSKKNKN